MNEDLPWITACVPSYNAEGFIARCVDSLLAQSYPNLRILVSDDDSSDSTVQICRERFGDNPWAEVITNDVRLGWVGNTNRLIDMVETPYMFFMGHDDELSPDYVERVSKVLIEDESVVIGFSDMVVARENRDPDVLVGAVTIDADDPVVRIREFLETIKWWVPYRGVIRTQSVKRSNGLVTGLVGEFAADFTWLLEMLLQGKFKRVTGSLYRKHSHIGNLSRTWKKHPSRYLGLYLTASKRVLVQDVSMRTKLRILIAIWTKVGNRALNKLLPGL